MIINKIKFPIYGTMILLSLILACIFIYFYLKKQKVKNKSIFYYLIMVIPFAMFGGICISYTFGDGLSSYAGALALLVASLFYEKINPSKNKDFIKSTLIALPLIYSISKIGCFFAGCCYGLPYDGALSVTYTGGLNIPLIPIQLIETIFFLIAFIVILILNKKHNKHIIEITLIICASLKLLLDFLRYDHLTKVITFNQIVSLILIIITVIYIIKNSRKS